MKHNKNFYSLEELERTRDSLKGYLDNEEVYYFVGAIRYACDEIERLNNIIEKIRNYVYKPVDKEWDDILCIIEDGRKRSDK